MSLAHGQPAATWPRSVPPQTALQKHLHHPHERRRTAIVSALVKAGWPEEHRWAVRLADCCCTALIFHEPMTGKVRPWLPRCGSRLCPFCGQGRAARVAEQLHDMIGTMKAPRHIILTFRSRTEPLGQQLAHMRAAWNKLRRMKPWVARVDAGVYTVEITRNPDTGLWHPHLHAIVDGEYFPQKLLSKLWSQCMDGGHHVWITKVHHNRNAAWELAKYVGKPPDAQNFPASAIVEFARAVHGKRMLQTFGSLHGRSTPAPEEPPAEKPKTRTIALSRLAWLATTGLPVARDLVAALWSRWPMFRGYLQEHAPQSYEADCFYTDRNLHCPRPPPLANGRYAPHADPEALDKLDVAIDILLLHAWGLEDAGRLEFQPEGAPT